MNPFKHLGQSLKEQAKKAAEQIRKEPTEIFESVKHQAAPQTGEVKTQQSQGPSVIDQIITQDGKFTPASAAEQAQIHAFTKRRLQEIENELRQLRMQREQKSQEWAKEQQQIMHPRGEEERKQQIALPPQRKQHGPPRPGGHKKGGTMEEGRSKKG